ncbi:Dak1-domain-containing protein [Aspergillus uvarum CBS 121591]|uniref:Dak1-domain-containing protein n=1 Tax=Aspergillus uvarum CBS 121591 TaxID=1448315 RepID=A0A319DH53_9EURO|nr:Dak1-domain-containing protein [Aspergillus uvarum CBS 121591]PYH78982.1 Dak1-domain-containing protein [Aspergillus uvarum CBS 121591]
MSLAMEYRPSFIQDPVQLVNEWCSAQSQLYPGLRFDEKHSILYKPNLSEAGRVTVLSGGGSGHEPAHFGYVGHGLLDAAVAGSLFASPNVKQINRALEVAASPQGTIVIVKNYTGDKLNFALAIERFKSRTGNDVRMVLVGDDVSVPRSRGKFVGRRGLAGVALVHKIAGAAAHRGLDMDRIVELCDLACHNMGTIGASLAPCHVPGHPSDLKIETVDILLGMGIHNEPPISTLPMTSSPARVIQAMLQLLLDNELAEHGFLEPAVKDSSRNTVLLLNNLGGLSTIEIGALTAMTITIMRDRYKMVPCSVLRGTYLSALDGHGFSITLLSLVDSADGSLLLNLLDEQTDAIGWTPPSSLNRGSEPDAFEIHTTHPASGSICLEQDCRSLRNPSNPVPVIVESILAEVTRAEPTITKYDVVLGDGDCGTTLLAGAQALKRASDKGLLSEQEFAPSLMVLADIVIDAMGGTSGAIYGIFLTAFAASLNRLQKDSVDLSVKDFSFAASGALDILMNYTGARIGDRTLMDALIPFVTELKVSRNLSGPAAFQRALESAELGCQSTRQLHAKFGRSTYVSENVGRDTANGHTRPADPGACGLLAVLNGIQHVIKGC